MRVGLGVDAHRLVPGRRLVLGGVEIDYDHGLEGHSDGDAALHAAIDALLGAAGLGDIGEHFPSSDPRYRGISSRLLLREAAAMLAAAGWRVVNLDLVIIAEQPRLAPYRQAMRAAIAADLGLPVAAVSVKATTTDGLGFTGRRDGIAAQAVALVERRV
ncbi:MAG: 2-C-methyl-D-erythritol 2,4-cyclodiphosphate synthase [Chloroflexota bacterium]|nr:2-C-methyl-D-erythritol 2,4-cyclodiphosphate synthase [Dehalococcoidia bacterium]MDW8255097.1 2-C-methyl-D-erythritol 2,4-cyclodiphosphate synthase [Chloroflexota bacterium]